MTSTKTFHTRKMVQLIPIVSGIVLLLLGINGYMEHGNRTLLLLAVLFGVTSIVGIFNLFPFVSSLVVTPKGILIRAFFRKTFVEWEEIESFENKKVLFQNKIAIHFKPTYGKKFLGIPIGKRRNNFTAVFPIQYNVKAVELQKRLEEIKNH